MEYSCIETKWGKMFHNQNDKDSLLKILSTKGTYQPYVISEAKNNVKKDGWVIDVGANIGAHTVPIAKIEWIGESTLLKPAQKMSNVWLKIHRLII